MIDLSLWMHCSKIYTMGWILYIRWAGFTTASIDYGSLAPFQSIQIFTHKSMIPCAEYISGPDSSHFHIDQFGIFHNPLLCYPF